MFPEDKKAPHGAREHVAVQAASLLDGREQRVGEEGLGFQESLHGHATSDLTSSHETPFPKGLTNSQTAVQVGREAFYTWAFGGHLRSKLWLRCVKSCPLYWGC